MQLKTSKHSTIYELVRKLYRNDKGDPLELSESQCILFDLIFRKRYARNHIQTFTQFGKSLVCGLGVLSRVSTYPEQWAIIGPTKDKAKIIIGYIIKHAFDNPYILSRLEIEEGESLERIRRERSKDKLTFKVEGGYGEVFVLSAEASRIMNVEKALMGYGAPNVLEDESALIPDKVHSTVMRMLGGHRENWLFKVGNPFKRNHFLRSFRDEKYHKFIVDWKQGVAEGRITQDFIDEMKKEAMFGILYDIEFPDEEAIDDKGYMPLISEKQLDLIYTDKIELFGELRLGVDVAGGGRNKSVCVLRGDNGAKLLYQENNPDTMAFTGEILKLMKEYKISAKNVFVDSIGVGKGVFNRLDEQKPGIHEVIAGAKPENEDDRFVDVRAQMFWRMAEWLKGGRGLEGQFDELLDIRYKVQSDKKIRIKPKIEMQREGIVSPDVADSLAMTFTRERPLTQKKYKQPEYKSLSEYEGK